MKLLLLAVSALVVGAGFASAADLAPKPYVKAPIAPAVYDWSGWYVGANGGGGWAQNSWSGTGAAAPPYLPSGYPIGSGTASGGTAGGQFGWRTQTGWLVWGLDFQGNWADISGSFTTGLSPRSTQIRNNKTTSYETIAATAGYAANNVLFYAKGGAAAVQNTFGTVHPNNPGLNDGNTESRWGGLLGAGIEYGLTPNWTIGVEYNHIFGGRVIEGFNSVTPTNTPSSVGITQNLDIVTARVNYKFGGPVVARY